MAIASKTFSVTSYEYGNYQSSDGNTNKAGIVTTIYWRIAYTDDSSTPQTVNVEGALAFDPYHLVNGTTDPRTGEVNSSYTEWADLNDAKLASWVESEYNRDSSLKAFCDYKANYLLTGADPDRKFEAGPFTRE